MKILITGSSTSASWRIRGEQLGAAIGATVQVNCMDPVGFDLAVLVKRPSPDLVFRVQRHRIPIVWDVVDAYPQPAGGEWTERACKSWLAERIDFIKPMAIVAATEAMADDCRIFDVPILCLPHHARPAQAINPIRNDVLTVGYEGGEAYLGEWRGWIELACAARGWAFHVKPQQLADLDIVVAMRDQKGYAPRHWKSNVKLANAQASGTPIICNRERGYLETQSGGERWADTRAELQDALDDLTPHATRWHAGMLMHRSVPTIDLISGLYRPWLHSLRSSS